MIKTIIIAVVVLAIILVIKKLISKPGFKENVSRRTYKWISIALVVGVIGVIGYTLFNSAKIYLNKNGDGQFAQEIKAISERFNDKGEVRISIRLDDITIGGRTYHNIESVKNIIKDNMERENSFVLIDDYARKDTYESVKEALNECGVTGENISYEETK